MNGVTRTGSAPELPIWETGRNVIARTVTQRVTTAEALIALTCLYPVIEG
ncbi:MAG: hypothetical protein IT340_11370 [Chloroflexi bacterium]|nr:hypothetical protein [Chloroflexota bacterium]